MNNIRGSRFHDFQSHPPVINLMIDRKNLGLFNKLGTLSLLLGLISIQTALACSPAPDHRPADIAEKAKAARYVFEGRVIEVTPPQVTIQVSQYFKGEGPAEVKMTGFNEHSCSDFLTEDQHAIFFGEGDINTMLSAVYDGAFGSARPISPENFAALSAAIDCMATYQDGLLHIPCLAVIGLNKLYSAELLWHKNSNAPMLFSARNVQQKKPKSGITNKPKAHVESIEIQILESFPVQVQVVVSGHLSDGCKKIDQIETVLLDNRFTVTITTDSVGEHCTQALEPFKKVIALDAYGLSKGIYTVDVNGITDTFELSIDNIPLPD